MPVTKTQYRELKERVKANTSQRQPVEAPERAAAWPWPLLPLQEFESRTFVCEGLPVGKPRQTQRDKWQKRPCVLRYRAFADRLRETAGTLAPKPDAVLVEAHVPMPKSWTKAKKKKLLGSPCRQRPDWDNLGKAVCDALFEEDAGIWLGLVAKYWCPPGSERAKVTILYAKSQ